MAYNYEYPYIDADRYNVDWILKRIKELHERLMKEIAEREEGYKYLFEKLETETTEREQADTDLRNELMDQVAEEQKRAEEAEGRIQRNLEALTRQVTQNAAENAREHAVLRDTLNSIEEELNAEEEARKAADKDLSDRLDAMDSDLNGRIDDLGTQLGEEITDNKEAIEKERAERIEQDGQIRNELAADSAAHTAAENALSRDLSEEAKQCEERDSVLFGDIHAEQQRAQSAEALLQQDINDEVTARTEADNALSDRLTREQEAREAADEKEASDRKAADEDLQRKLDEEAEFRGKADDALKAELRTEERVREAKDAIIEQNLNAEKDRAQKAENQLDLDVKNEAAARMAEDRKLYGRIGDEEAERKTADKLLEGMIQTESNERKSEDQRIEGLITEAQTEFTEALEQEKTERQAADTTIQESVTQEQERAHSEEQRIEGLITYETAAREQADTNLQGQFADDLATTEEELREYVDSKVGGGLTIKPVLFVTDFKNIDNYIAKSMVGTEAYEGNIGSATNAIFNSYIFVVIGKARYMVNQNEHTVNAAVFEIHAKETGGSEATGIVKVDDWTGFIKLTDDVYNDHFPNINSHLFRKYSSCEGLLIKTDQTTQMVAEVKNMSEISPSIICHLNDTAAIDPFNSDTENEIICGVGYSYDTERYITSYSTGAITSDFTSVYSNGLRLALPTIDGRIEYVAGGGVRYYNGLTQDNENINKAKTWIQSHCDSQINYNIDMPRVWYKYGITSESGDRHTIIESPIVYMDKFIKIKNTKTP